LNITDVTKLAKKQVQMKVKIGPKKSEL